MKKLILILGVFAALVGCSADEQATYQDSQAFIGFISSSVDLKVPINSSSSVDLVLRASNKSSVARTYNVSLIAAETDANIATYSFPATFTIPAGSYTGNLTITGTDNNLIDSRIRKITLQISGFGANESFDNNKAVINMVEFCAVNPVTFSGNFSSNTWWIGGPSVNQVVAGSAANTLSIKGFFSDNAARPDFNITYNPNNNNRVTFTEVFTGYTVANGPIWARMSTNAANVSSVDACTGRVNLWVNYFIPNVGSYGDKNEIFIKQ
jgi:hypothetical protein